MFYSRHLSKFYSFHDVCGNYGYSARVKESFKILSFAAAKMLKLRLIGHAACGCLLLRVVRVKERYILDVTMVASLQPLWQGLEMKGSQGCEFEAHHAFVVGVVLIVPIFGILQFGRGPARNWWSWAIRITIGTSSSHSHNLIGRFPWLALQLDDGN
jgi:hypothetical protein